MEQKRAKHETRLTQGIKYRSGDEVKLRVDTCRYLNVLHVYYQFNNYRTLDSTGVCDYIHVLDLGEEHVQALDYAFTHPRAIEINLGASHGYFVLELVKELKKRAG